MSNVVLSIKDLSYSYANGNIVLDNFNIEIARGELLFILGPNGIGKSTLLNCIMKILPINRGEIKIENKNIFEFSHKQLARKIAYVSQKTIVPQEISVEDYLLLARAPYKRIFERPNKQDKEMVRDIAEQLNLESYLDRKLDRLSGGEQQKIHIARSLVQGCDIIIMDEPTSALDFKMQISTLSLLKTLIEVGKTIIITTHNPNFPLWCDGSVLLLGKNNQLHGDTNEVMTDKNLSELYNSEIKIISCGNYRACVPNVSGD